jgi:hypothetical protein
MSCRRPSPKPFLIGIINDDSINNSIHDGSKAGLASQRFAEGARIAFVQEDSVFASNSSIENQISRVMTAESDAILALGGYSAVYVGRVLSGRKIPIVCAPASDQILR